MGLFITRHKLWVLLAWLLALAGVVTLVNTFGANTSNNLELPGTGSQSATDLLAKEFPPQQNGQNQIVFRAPEGEKVTDPELKRAIDESADEIEKIPHVFQLTSPFSTTGQGQLSKDERTAYLNVLLDIGNQKITEGYAERFLEASQPGRDAGMEVAAGGQIGAELSEPETKISDLIGIIAAMMILTITFGTLVAMGMAILPAVLGLICGLSLLGLLGHVKEVPSIAPTLATMIGLGVGIDYALFMVSRYRVHRDEGMATDAAIAKSVGTTGTAIVFAGGTVVIALVSLLVAQIPLVTSLGYASAVAVVTAVAAALTLLPALLALVGDRIDSLGVPGFMQMPPKRGGGLWHRWAGFVTARPGWAVLITLGVLTPLLIPSLSLQLGQPDTGAAPLDTTERQAYDMITAGFGPGYNGPLLVAVDLGDEPAKPSEEFNKQYAKAQSLQSQLEAEQAEGETGAESLQRSADELEAQEQTLLAEKDTLETKAGDLKTEKGRLQKNAAKLAEQRDILAQLQLLVDEALTLVKQAAKLAAQASDLVAKLDKVLAAEAAATNPEVKAALAAEAKRLEAQLNDVKQEQQELNQEGKVLAGEINDLEQEATKLGDEAFAIAVDAAEAAAEAVTLLKQKNKLVQQAANLKVRAANLNTQKVQLEALQQQAEVQAQQAQKLQATLTDELTLAGGDKRGTDTRLVTLQQDMSEALGVALVSPPDINKSGVAAVFGVISKYDPADERTTEVVTRLREFVIPQASEGEEMTAYVGGSTAANMDLATGITGKLALVFLTVVSLGFLVLLMAFRSFIVATQAVIAIVLAVCAAFGVLTAVFQYGWGVSLVGIDTTSASVPIASYVPLIMFAVLFGLSMDYQVFLMSQIEHARSQGAKEADAVREGLAGGGRVIFAAALIMMSVFGSFIINGDPTVKQFGVGLSVGVLLAALCVLLLAPAIMTMADKAAWWMPRWADRFVPHIDIEGMNVDAEIPDSKDGKKRRRKKPKAFDSMKL
ncbi:MAG: MMPL family transporter [Actinobacteria bacterium]|nr:MMPL family transporter [Actinomycetota bacterium]